MRSTFKEALFQGLPQDNGLFMPLQIPILPLDFIKNIDRFNFQQIAFEISNALLADEIPATDLKQIVHRAINFPAPVVELGDRAYVLELFHGPSLAFKDFGARFMAETMSYYNQQGKEEKALTILVATSGDTGGAVAAGFLNIPGVRVVILYPSGKVSPLQEKQLTGLGSNITALEINGTFDNCQALVKQAFLDAELRRQFRLSSANSINIARLIPQIFYYFEAFKQVYRRHSKITFVVPSGNFGNLTAGLLAQKMGLPIAHFVAATNINDVVPEYLNTGNFQPRASIPTISNAMDVGNPSNFARMLDMFGSTWNIIKEHVSGYGFNDITTLKAIREIYARYQYVMDPHGAVAYLAWKDFTDQKEDESAGIILETAHPAKFLETVQEVLQTNINLPKQLKELLDKEKQATYLNSEYPEFKNWLLENL